MGNETARSAPEPKEAPEAAARAAAEREAKGQRGVELLNTGDPAALPLAVRNIQDATNTPRTKEQTIARFKEMVSAEMPTPPKVLFREEKTRMKRITERLVVPSGGRRETPRGRKSYLQPWSGTDQYEVNNGWIKADLEWLRNASRTGDGQPAERKEYFGAYARLLEQLTLLNSPKRNQEFGDITTCENNVARSCSNPKSITSATRMTFLLAAAGLALAWGISDYRHKKLSIGTMILLGGIALLMYKGSKNDFLGGKPLAKLSKGPLNAKTTASLQNLARSKPAVYGHLLSTMRSATTHREPIDEKLIQTLINPTKRRRGKDMPDRAKAVPESIARLFEGQNASDVFTVLNGLKGTARTRDRSKVSAYVGALSENGSQTRQDLATVRSSSSSTP